MADQEEQARKMLEEQAKKMGSLIAKCWSDDGFKKKFLADPAATLKSEGVSVDMPAGMTMKAVENTDKIYHFVVPAKPTELTEEQLDMVAGGEISFTYQKCGFCQGTTPACVPTPCGGCGCVWTMGGCGCAQPIPPTKQK
jgi:Nitrile hydratase, alpha chain